MNCHGRGVCHNGRIQQHDLLESYGNEKAASALVFVRQEDDTEALPQEAWAVGAAHLPLDRLFGGPHDLAASMAPATAASATMAMVRLPGSCCA